MKGRIEIEVGGTGLSMQEARRIEDIAERAAAQQEFRVRLPIALMSEENLERLEKLFAAAPGLSQVVFELESPDGTVAVVASQQRVKASPELAEALRRRRGESAAATEMSTPSTETTNGRI